ncbi:ADP-ribose glycohydrolase MACROD1 isoform X3 [Betta splendens]|uniref:ADP-ribose glycohydrolase MACROD1 isoform X3 n=1 Tax=Betta splendens TaxID=158456 RepID=A0A6P7NU60_BETSP|nr:ADP-ribose glycohydrolase MACROD1 isoform X3 [Betta splendens]
MAFQISTLLSYVKVLPRRPGALSRSRADLQAAGVKFRRPTPERPPLGAEPAAGPRRGHICVARKFSATLWRSGRGLGSSSGWLGRVALGAALGVSTAALVQSVHTGTLAAMALKVNLSSAEGDWKQTKDFLLSLPVKDRRLYYRTDPVPLDDIPVWTPAGGSEPARCQRNEKLDQKISLYSGDITKLEIDAIVNAVDGAIHRVAGPMLKKECASLHGCETGEAKITCGYGLPAKHVIHTVGPIAQGGVGEQERAALRSCYRNSLKTATDHAARSVAFPCISTGIYGYPPEQAVHEALATVREYLDAHDDKVDRVVFCVFLPTDKDLYLQNLPLYFPAGAGVFRAERSALILMSVCSSCYKVDDSESGRVDVPAAAGACLAPNKGQVSGWRKCPSSISVQVVPPNKSRGQLTPAHNIQQSG